MIYKSQLIQIIADINLTLLEHNSNIPKKEKYYISFTISSMANFVYMTVVETKSLERRLKIQADWVNENSTQKHFEQVKASLLDMKQAIEKYIAINRKSSERTCIICGVEINESAETNCCDHCWLKS